MGETGCDIWGKGVCVGELKKNEKKELISDIWGKRGATSGEKGGVSANFKKKTPGVSSSDGGCDASMLSSCERVGFITSSRLLSAYGDVRVGGGVKRGGWAGRNAQMAGALEWLWT